VFHAHKSRTAANAAVGDGEARARVEHKLAPEAPGGAGYAHAVLAIVPAKPLDGAKSRLAPVFSPEGRAVLARTMLENVLSACANSAAVTRMLVVTPEPALVPNGHEVLVDDGAGHAQAIALALAEPRDEEGVLVVMSDCPLLRADSLDRLAEAAEPVALAPARDGGLNALAVRGPLTFEPVFGVPEAAARTAEQARAAGAEPTLIDDPLLALDFDRPEDVTALILAR
jgi:2-phospho-L-lactate guanylyltransferase